MGRDGVDVVVVVGEEEGGIISFFFTGIRLLTNSRKETDEKEKQTKGARNVYNICPNSRIPVVITY